MRIKSLILTRPLGSSAGRVAQGRRVDAATHQVLSDVFKQKYSASLFFFAIGIVACGILDAYWTLLLLTTGSVVELNPIMLAFIERDIRLFMIAKAIITGVSVVALVACSALPHLSRLNARYVIKALFLVYLLLICYESQLFYSLM